MRIRIIAVGTKMPSWVQQGVAEYHKRMPGELSIDVREIPLGKRHKKDRAGDVSRIIEAEGQMQLAAIGKGDHVVALDVLGKSWSTEQLATTMSRWQMSGVDTSLLIGGPDGLSPACLERADQRWSLSDLTLPHPLVRIILAEQLYRAWTINNNHPYHR